MNFPSITIIQIVHSRWKFERPWAKNGRNSMQRFSSLKQLTFRDTAQRWFFVKNMSSYICFLLKWAIYNIVIIECSKPRMKNSQKFLRLRLKITQKKFLFGRRRLKRKEQKLNFWKNNFAFVLYEEGGEVALFWGDEKLNEIQLSRTLLLPSLPPNRRLSCSSLALLLS